MNRPNLVLFGPPRLECDGRHVLLSRRTALALLAYLSLEKNPCSRDVLIGFLWPEAQPEQGQRQLRNTLYELNRSPAGSGLTVDRHTIRLNPDAFRIDALDFQLRYAQFKSHHPGSSPICPACRESLNEALFLYSGSFMSGFSIRESTEFEHWVTMRSEQFNSVFTRIARLLFEYHYDRGQFDHALEYTRHMLEVEPTNETAHRRRMRVYWQSGQPEDALRQYELCRRILEEDLGVQPSSETEMLFKKIQSHRSTPRSQPRRRYTLPVPLTPFFGRQRELERLRALLADRAVRLLTLTGMGGSGKTRLALEVGRQVENSYPDGAAWVNLVPVTSQEFVLSAIGDAMEIQTSVLGDALKKHHLLLILDNIEHLSGGLSFIPDLLRHAPDIQILITSRSRLNLSAEWVFEVRGMSYPEGDRTAETSEFESVAFFDHVARRQSGRFDLTGTERTGIERICSLVGGNPLAIELASSWVSVLSCDRIADEIEKSIDFLINRQLDTCDRHQSLRAVFDHSWNQLTSPEKQYLQRLAVMRGGFSRESAHWIARVELDDLARLIDKSLVRNISGDRYELHEIVRQYAQDWLKRDLHESERTERLHAEYFLGLLKNLEADLKGNHQKRALQTILTDIDNVRLAWLWAVEHDLLELLESGCIPLFLFYDLRSRNMDACRMFGPAWRKLENGVLFEERRRIIGLCKAFDGWFLRYSNGEESKRLLGEAIDQLSPDRDPVEWAIAFDLYSFLGIDARAKERIGMLEKAEAIFRQCGDDWGIAMNLEAIGACLGILGETDAAKQAVQKSLETRSRIGDAWGIAMSLEMLGRFEEDDGNIDAAAMHYRNSLDRRQAIDADFGGMINCLQGLGRLSLRRDDPEKARSFYTEALELAKQIMNHQRIAEVTDRLGGIALRNGETEQAREYFDEALEMYRKVNARDAVKAIQGYLSGIG